jgi:hypothetical protein
MKWIFTLLTISMLSSCVTKPYMVGSVNDMFYKRHHIPGYVAPDTDYSWQARLYNTAHIPVLYRVFKTKRVYREQVVETAPAPVTYSK